VTPAELKKALVAQGFEVYRTIGDEVRIAERPRENLILDSGVRVRLVETGFSVVVVFRAEKRAHPDWRDTGIFSRVALSAKAAEVNGFAEAKRQQEPVEDPSRPGQLLDTFYEITMVAPATTLAEAADLVRFGLSLERLVHPPQ
jgi:hypothetical protein